MRPARRNQRDLTEPGIVEALRRVPGVTVFRLDQPVDLLVGFRGANHLLEVKTPTREGGPPRRLTRAESQFFETWTGSATIVCNAAEALSAVLGEGVSDGAI
jgi:hypothetical protein